MIKLFQSKCFNLKYFRYNVTLKHLASAIVTLKHLASVIVTLKHLDLAEMEQPDAVESQSLLPFSTGLSFSRRIPMLKSRKVPLFLSFLSFLIGSGHLWLGDAFSFMFFLISALLVSFVFS